MKEKIIKICPYCQNSFSVPPSLGTRKFCSKKCVDSHKSNGFTANCQTCGKTFAISPVRKSSARFCSKECKATKIKKICQTCGKTYFVHRCHAASKFCNRFCKRHSEQTKLILAAKSKNRKPNENQLKGLKIGQSWAIGKTKENNPSIAKRARILSEKYKGQHQPQFETYRKFMKTSEYSKQLSERMKKYYAENPEKHINFILAQKGFETSLERKMRLALESKQISFEKQFRIDKFWCDFAVVSSRLVIEVDGEYWHDKEKDAKRDSVIESLGWKVIRFSEKQVKADIEFCLSQIQNFIST